MTEELKKLVQQQFAKTISAIEPEPTQKIEPLPEPEVVPESAKLPAVLAQAENAPDHQLAAAMAAAVSAKDAITPPCTTL